MSSTTRRVVLWISIPVAAFAIVGGFLSRVTAGEDAYQHLKIFDDVAGLITCNYVEKVDIDKVMALYARFRGRVRMSFGVGTNLTNDLGPAPLQIVLKMVRCNGQPVAKLSDTPGKTMVDDPGYLAYLRQVFGVPAP